MAWSITTVDSPLGEIVIVSNEMGVRVIEFADEWPRAEARLRRAIGPAAVLGDGDPADAVPRLRAYFAGELHAVEQLIVEPFGTPFQHNVWRELRAIAPGSTISYSQLAERVHCPRGQRAVGSANRLNPVAIVVPCHRVVGRDGGLRGYAGGVDRKQWLLAHERTMAVRFRPAACSSSLRHTHSS
jgi:methylated-DNA-[protein]-cysteine S-methyltransferase